MGKRFSQDLLSMPSLAGLKYTDGNTFIHKLHPVVKLIFLFLFTFTIFFTNHYLVGLFSVAWIIIAYHIAGLGIAYFMKKLRFILIFSIMIFLVQILFYQEGSILWTINLFGFNINIWTGGLSEGINIALRFFNIIALSFLFISTTAPNKLIYGLMQLGIPYRYGFMLITALRFIPAYQNDFKYIRNAQLAKGISFEGFTINNFKYSIRYLFIPLIITNLAKVDTLTVSMEGRAFGKHHQRTYMEKQSFQVKDWVFICLASFILLSLIKIF